MFSMVHNSVDPITCNISSCMNAIPKKVKIGRFEVNRLGYGAMRLTGKGVWGEPSDPATAKKVLQSAVELGVNFIDTADVYGPEVSERIIGETLAPYKPGLVIATKNPASPMQVQMGLRLGPPSAAPYTFSSK
jgi:aryl-alcohol dehydrogenase-like predicted oxidoreductase